VFDLIGGSSAGALTAAMMVMKWPMEKIKIIQDKLCVEVFAHGLSQSASETSFSNHWARLHSRLK
jgi:hypothetical protein